MLSKLKPAAGGSSTFDSAMLDRTAASLRVSVRLRSLFRASPPRLLSILEEKWRTTTRTHKSKESAQGWVNPRRYSGIDLRWDTKCLWDQKWSVRQREELQKLFLLWRGVRGFYYKAAGVSPRFYLFQLLLHNHLNSRTDLCPSVCVSFIYISILVDIDVSLSFLRPPSWQPLLMVGSLLVQIPELP